MAPLAVKTNQRRPPVRLQRHPTATLCLLFW